MRIPLQACRCAPGSAASSVLDAWELERLAARRVRDGHRTLDVLTPFPLAEVDAVLDLQPSRIRVAMLIAGFYAFDLGRILFGPPTLGLSGRGFPAHGGYVRLRAVRGAPAR